MIPKDFIQKVLINNIGDISYKYHYISFLLIANGIEFLGKCLDEKHEFNHYEKGLPRKHFNNAIEELMPKYNSINKKYDLYSTLRNGFSHMISPKAGIWLSQRKNTNNYNLEEHDEGLILKAEDFYDDFKIACEEIINRIETKRLKHEKMDIDFITTKRLK